MAIKREPVHLLKWTVRDFPYHKYSQDVILQEIIDWLYEFMGPAQPGPMPEEDEPPGIYSIPHYGNGWLLEARGYGGGCVGHFVHFETDAHEMMFRLIWR